MTHLDLDFKPSFYPREVFSYSRYVSTLGVTKAAAKRIVKKLQEERVVRSETHQVALNTFSAPAFGAGTWLSIKQIDRGIITDRQVLARIMRQILPGHCGFELFPAPERLVDTANQYHCWAFTCEQVEVFRTATLGEPQNIPGAEARQLRFSTEGTPFMAAIPLEGRGDWRDIFELKERSFPGCEGVMYFDQVEGHLLADSLVCLTDPGLSFPFGFKERLVLDDDESMTGFLGARQRAFGDKGLQGELSPMPVTR